MFQYYCEVLCGAYANVPHCVNTLMRKTLNDDHLLLIFFFVFVTVFTLASHLVTNLSCISRLTSSNHSKSWLQVLRVPRLHFEEHPGCNDTYSNLWIVSVTVFTRWQPQCLYELLITTSTAQFSVTGSIVTTEPLNWPVIEKVSAWIRT